MTTRVTLRTALDDQALLGGVLTIDTPAIFKPLENCPPLVPRAAARGRYPFGEGMRYKMFIYQRVVLDH
jgi:hypothetical protein